MTLQVLTFLTLKLAAIFTSESVPKATSTVLHRVPCYSEADFSTPQGGGKEGCLLTPWQAASPDFLPQLPLGYLRLPGRVTGQQRVISHARMPEPSSEIKGQTCEKLAWRHLLLPQRLRPNLWTCSIAEL